jgi:hypothetical protein
MISRRLLEMTHCLKRGNDSLPEAWGPARLDALASRPRICSGRGTGQGDHRGVPATDTEAAGFLALHCAPAACQSLTGSRASSMPLSKAVMMSYGLGADRLAVLERGDRPFDRLDLVSCSGCAAGQLDSVEVGNSSQRLEDSVVAGEAGPFHDRGRDVASQRATAARQRTGRSAAAAPARRDGPGRGRRPPTLVCAATIQEHDRRSAGGSHFPQLNASPLWTAQSLDHSSAFPILTSARKSAERTSGKNTEYTRIGMSHSQNDHSSIAGHCAGRIHRNGTSECPIAGISVPAIRRPVCESRAWPLPESRRPGSPPAVREPISSLGSLCLWDHCRHPVGESVDAVLCAGGDGWGGGRRRSRRGTGLR